MQYTNFYLILSTFFGLGKISGRIAGSIGSLMAFPITWYCFQLSKLFSKFLNFDNIIINSLLMPIICTVILFTIGAISASKYSKYCTKTDPKEIVIDEIVGQMLCLILTVPISLLIYQIDSLSYPIDLFLIGMLVTNYILFRFFDILKPWPINFFDKKFTGGFGIMFDDILAAIFAIVIYFAIFLNIIDYLK